MSRAIVGIRALAGLHLLGGAVLTARPREVSRAVGGSPAPVWLVRALGARLSAQGLLEVGYPRRRVLLGGALVDATHAASMLAVATVWPDYRRPALVSGSAAAASALLSVSLRRQARS